jgi:hypothetical protein
MTWKILCCQSPLPMFTIGSRLVHHLLATESSLNIAIAELNWTELRANALCQSALFESFHRDFSISVLEVFIPASRQLEQTLRIVCHRFGPWSWLSDQTS